MIIEPTGVVVHLSMEELMTLHLLLHDSITTLPWTNEAKTDAVKLRIPVCSFLNCGNYG